MNETSKRPTSLAHLSEDGTVEFFVVTTARRITAVPGAAPDVALMGRAVFDVRANTITVVAPHGARESAFLGSGGDPVARSKDLLCRLYQLGQLRVV
jgi:hypothetical protein